MKNSTPRRGLSIVCLFLMMSGLSPQVSGQGYPLTSDEVGLVGAGVTTGDLTVINNAGTVYLTSGTYELIHWEDANIVISGPNVTIRKCLVTWNGNGYAAIANNSRYGGLVIEDSEVDGQGNYDTAGIWPGSYTLLRSYVHNVGNDGVKAQGDVVIHRSWIGPLVNGGADPHSDVIQLSNNSVDLPVVLTCNTFYGFLENGDPVNVNAIRLRGSIFKGDVVVVGNSLLGAIYNQMHFGGNSADTYRIEDNVFIPYGVNKPLYNGSDGTHLSWSGNVLDDGTPIPLTRGGSNYTVSKGTVPTIAYTTCEDSSGGSGFVETVGTGTSANVGSYTGWDENGVLTFSEVEESGNCEVAVVSSDWDGSAVLVSGYQSSASGRFLISGIDTTGMTGIELSFVTKFSYGPQSSYLEVEYSTDGSSWTAIDISGLVSTSSNVWQSIAPTDSLPAVSNLRLRFSYEKTTDCYLDDISISAN